MKNVGILTLPLTGNYGGMLQAACLYRTLQSLGHSPYFLDMLPRPKTLKQTIISLVSHLPMHDWRGSRTRRMLKKTHAQFVKSYLGQRSDPVFGTSELQKATDDLRLDAVVVGSDQVWRFEYQGEDQGLAYFLDITRNIRRIAYAASFGHTEWKYPSRTAEVSQLLQRFHTVTVRERSGITICKDTLGRSDAKVVCDPTLLTERDFLEEVAEKNAGPAGILIYALDAQKAASRVAEVVKSERGLRSARVNLISSHTAGFSVGAWIAGFRDADFVVTDSFHGTVMAIMFEKPFITLGNSERGLDRFLTLLERIGLLDRLIVPGQDEMLPKIIANDIDFPSVRDKIIDYRADSLKALSAALS